MLSLAAVLIAKVASSVGRSVMDLASGLMVFCRKAREHGGATFTGL